jgi:hypothetical protein
VVEMKGEQCLVESTRSTEILPEIPGSISPTFLSQSKQAFFHSFTHLRSAARSLQSPFIKFHGHQHV